MATQAQRIVEHYDHAAQDLVEAHTKLEHSPLVLAVRYHIKGDLDLHLLEVIENFPGRDEDPPFTTEFAPNERLLILGKLHLTLANPKQLEQAISASRAGRPRAKAAPAQKLLDAVKEDGQVLFQAKSPPLRAKAARALKKALGLS
jgi:hypothetical protein